jgi:DNA repair protein RadC
MSAPEKTDALQPAPENTDALQPAPENEQKHARHRRRLRRAAGHRPDLLDPVRLTELLLFEVIPRVDTNGIARELLESLGGPAGLLDPWEAEALPEGAAQYENTEIYLRVIAAVCRRYLDREDLLTVHLQTLRGIRAAFPGELPLPETDAVAVLTLDADLERQRFALLPADEAGLTAITRFVTRAAGADYAKCLFLAFLHPHGFLAPTPREIRLAVELWEQCNLSGVFFAEAAVVNADGVFYLSESPIFPEGMFPAY